MDKTTTLLAIMLGATLTISILTILLGTPTNHVIPALTLSAISILTLVWAIKNDKENK